jgi:aryl-alcohol dehydrogenase-like predicted oxidoreductase
MTMRPEPYEHLRTDAVFDLLEGLQREADEQGTTMAALALAWLLENPRVTAVIVGPRRPGQLEPALAALRRL